MPAVLWIVNLAVGWVEERNPTITDAENDYVKNIDETKIAVGFRYALPNPLMTKDK